jgi:hypothetical protein
MDVNQSGCQDGIAEVHHPRPSRNRHAISVANGRYDSAVDHKCGILDALKGSK